MIAEDRETEPPTGRGSLWEAVSRLLLGFALTALALLTLLVLHPLLFLLGAALLVVLALVARRHLGVARLWQVPAALARSRPHDREPVPVRHLRVRRHTGEERIVRLEGYYHDGHLMPGDEVVLRGRWERGTLLFHRGWNERTRTRVTLRPRPARGLLGWTVLAMLACAALSIHLCS